MSHHLEPCAHCGSKAYEFPHGANGIQERKTFRVGCGNPKCGITTQWRTKPDHARNDWNKRPKQGEPHADT